ncbi:MAG: GNAT family N-acetyltransferase, partial [Halobacteriota archaeon]
YLAEPNADLLEFALSTGNLLVSTTPTASDDVSTSTAHSPSAPGDDTVVGYILPVYGDAVYVAEVVVDPVFRRAGQAAALFEAVFERAADRRVTLTVAPDNGPALALYRSLGFDCIDRVADNFERGAALLLARDAPGG